MNIQALMKQAQTLQKDMTKAKDEIDKTIFEGESALVKISAKGTKQIVKIEIKKEMTIEKEDIEMLEDMLIVAINNTFNKIDKATEEKLGKFSNSMPGLF